LGPWRQLSGRHSGRRSGAGRRRHQRARPPVRRLLAPGVCARGRLRRDRPGGVCITTRPGSPRRPAEPLRDGGRDMRADGLLATLDRWGRLILPGTLLLFFVLLTLAPLRAPYLSDALPLLPALVVFQFSLATPERLPGLLLLAMGILLDLLLG